MRFDPAIHTKESLLSNPDAAFDFAKNSPEFAKNDLATDFKITKLVNYFGDTVAHKLAKYQPAWVDSEAAKSLEILSLVDNYGITVAHRLAENQSGWVHTEAAKSLEILRLVNNYRITVAHRLSVCQSEWIHSEAAKSFEIIKMTDIFGGTVAHNLAQYQSEWICSEAAKSFEILKLADNDGRTVALFLARNNANCINHEPLFQKQILTLEHQGKSLAEEISKRYKSKGFDVAVMAVKLISQGAAYRHSVAIDLDVGEEILNQSKTLIEDSSEPLIALKQLQALYSTFSHNVTKIISTQEQIALQKWQALLLQSETMIRQYLNKHPDLYDIEHTIDIHCEPGDDLLKKLKSERVMSSNLTSLHEVGAELSSEQVSKVQSFY